MEREIELSAKMIATLTNLVNCGPSPVNGSQASFFKRHDLAVKAEGVPAAKPRFSMMEITQKGRDALAAANGGAA